MVRNLFVLSLLSFAIVGCMGPEKGPSPVTDGAAALALGERARDEYLAASVGQDWVYTGHGRFTRAACTEPGAATGREDI